MARPRRSISSEGPLFGAKAQPVIDRVIARALTFGAPHRVFAASECERLLAEAVIVEASRRRVSSRQETARGRAFFLSLRQPCATEGQHIGAIAQTFQDYIERDEALEPLDPAGRPMEAGLAALGVTFAEGEHASFGTLGSSRAERRQFWLDVEEHFPARSRCFGRVHAELPFEATPAERLAIALAFASRMFAHRAIPFHCALHRPTADNDPRNYHLHLIFLDRPAARIMAPEAIIALADGKRAHQGQTRLRWDFAVPLIDRQRFPAPVSYPHRSPQDPLLSSRSAANLMRETYADVVSEQAREVGAARRYDPYRNVDVEPLKDLDVPALDLLKGVRQPHERPLAFQAIFSNERRRTRRKIKAFATSKRMQRAPQGQRFLSRPTRFTGGYSTGSPASGVAAISRCWKRSLPGGARRSRQCSLKLGASMKLP